jgi:transposase
MKEFTRIGLDLAKNYFQVHALAEPNGLIERHKLSRIKVLAFFSELKPSLIGMEACGSAHFWARELSQMGHEVYLIPPSYIKPYVKRGKNDAVDAEAICEAMSRPGMRFVPIKTAEQQAVLMLHSTRDLLIKQRTMCINALRGHLSEFGIIAAKGVDRVKELLSIAEQCDDLPRAAKESVVALSHQINRINESVHDLEQQIRATSQENEVTQLVEQIPGIGKITASLITASVADPGAFKSGRDMAAWLGLTPRQNSSGGKQSLGRITKQGNKQIRTLLVLGATSLLRAATNRQGSLRDWIVDLRARKPARLVTVAVANKLARIIWAVMTTGEAFRAEIFMKA